MLIYLSTVWSIMLMDLQSVMASEIFGNKSEWEKSQSMEKTWTEASHIGANKVSVLSDIWGQGNRTLFFLSPSAGEKRGMITRKLRLIQDSCGYRKFVILKLCNCDSVIMLNLCKI